MRTHAVTWQRPPLAVTAEPCDTAIAEVRAPFLIEACRPLCVAGKRRYPTAEDGDGNSCLGRARIHPAPAPGSRP